MINNKEFAERLKKVIDYYGESASSFAEKISVQRSSISHILSGRNKPSLEFVLKTLTSYPEVDLYWLINGKGYFPTIQKKMSFETKSESTSKELPEQKFLSNTDTDPIKKIRDKDKTIEQIIIFYSDGSFKNFQN